MCRVCQPADCVGNRVVFSAMAMLLSINDFGSPIKTQQTHPRALPKSAPLPLIGASILALPGPHKHRTPVNKRRSGTGQGRSRVGRGQCASLASCSKQHLQY